MVTPNLARLQTDLPIFKSETQTPMSSESVDARFDGVSPLESPPLTISFHELSYVIPGSKSFIPHWRSQDKTILQPFSGIMKPGEFWALMGPSGSGKSTFLNILAYRVPVKHVRGTVAINSQPLTKEVSKHFGYVMQDDVLHENLTVRETLMYTMMLRKGSIYCRKKMIQKIERVMEELGLSHCADDRIGGLLARGLSGGERKRVAIGIELCKEHSSVLLLDEPSSGLDSATAYQTLLTLRRLCSDKNRTVICTIHQPHSKIYKLFDNILLLSNGRCIYNGPARSALDYFADLGYPAEEHTNPSDHMLDLISIDCRSECAEMVSQRRVTTLHQTYLGSEMFLERHEESKQLTALVDPSALSIFSGHARRLARNCCDRFHEWPRFLVLCHRTARDMSRDVLPLLLRFVQAIVMSVVLGLFYFNLQPVQESIYDRQGALFFLIVQQSSAPIVIVLSVFQTEKRIYQREHNQGLFRSPTFYAAKVLSEVPFLIIIPIIVATIAFPMINLQSDWAHLLVAYACLIVTAFAAQAIGLAIGTWSPTVQVANTVMPIIVSFMLLFSGLFVNSANIPVYFRWIEVVNYLKYAYEILTFNDLNGLPFTCDEATKEEWGRCPVSTGNDILQAMNMNDVNIGYNFGYLFGLILVFHLVAYIGLKFMKPTHT